MQSDGNKMFDSVDKYIGNNLTPQLKKSEGKINANKDFNNYVKYNADSINSLSKGSITDRK